MIPQRTPLEQLNRRFRTRLLKAWLGCAGLGGLATTIVWMAHGHFTGLDELALPFVLVAALIVGGAWGMAAFFPTTWLGAHTLGVRFLRHVRLQARLDRYTRPAFEAVAVFAALVSIPVAISIGVNWGAAAGGFAQVVAATSLASVIPAIAIITAAPLSVGGVIIADCLRATALSFWDQF